MSPTNKPTVAEDPPGPPVFEDITKAAGIDFTYRNGEEAGHFAIIESVGGGVALFDFDNDGLLDIFFPGGGGFAGKTVTGNPGKLYRNLGGLHFEDVSKKVGLDQPFQYSHGAAAFDFDNDGWLDLLVTGYDRVVLFHNEPGLNGDRRFVDITAKAGLKERLWSTAAAWGDIDGDGYSDLYISHYGDWGFDSNHPLDCSYDGKTRDVCQPKRFKPLQHSIYKNNRNGTFTDLTKELKLRSDGKGLGVLFVDVNGDGRPDIYVANDTDDKFLYMNRGKPGEFQLEEGGLFAGVARDDRGIANGSMGLAVGDFDRSGRPSLLVTNYEGELPGLYQNRTTIPTHTQFIYATQSSALTAVGGTYVGWGVGFLDYDQDGWEDILFVNGHAIRYPLKIDRRQKPVLFQNQMGRFRDKTRDGGNYFKIPHNARGAAFGDLDNDGKIDLVVSHMNEPVSVLHNIAETEGNSWIGFNLKGEKNRDIVGSRIILETTEGKQTRFVVGGGSFASTNDRRLVFGLGKATSITKLTVVWSNGLAQEFKGTGPGSYWELTEKLESIKKVK